MNPMIASHQKGYESSAGILAKQTDTVKVQTALASLLCQIWGGFVEANWNQTKIQLVFPSPVQPQHPDARWVLILDVRPEKNGIPGGVTLEEGFFPDSMREDPALWGTCRKQVRQRTLAIEKVLEPVREDCEPPKTPSPS